MTQVTTLHRIMRGAAYFSCAHYGGCDLKSAGQAHSLYSRCLGYALPMVLSTNFPCSQWALIPNERS